MISFISEILKNMNKQNKFIHTDNRLVVNQKGSGWRGKWVKGFNYMVTDGN